MTQRKAQTKATTSTKSKATDDTATQSGRQPYAAAKSANFGIAASTSAPAKLVRTAKGSNPKRNKVYGYDNGGNGGRVPVHATVSVVGTGGPVVAYFKANPKHTVQQAYDSKALTSRQVRRAFRAGLIRFTNV